jgi:hypothetical protein
MKVHERNLATLLFIHATCCVTGFVVPKTQSGLQSLNSKLQLRSEFAHFRPTPIQVSSSASGEIPKAAKKKKKTIEDFREEGGILSINTPIGALNPFALYYGLVSLFLGFPWYIALKTCQFMYWITGGRFDKQVR